VRTHSKLTITGVLGAVAAALVLGAGPASADPAANTYPTLAGTGSDTTQFVLDGLGDVIPAIGSYDALVPSTGLPGGLIQTRANGVQFNRPNGSGAGLKALTASINPTGTYTQPKTVGGVTTQVSITGQLDFARSSSTPSVAGTQLTFIPFGKDAVSYAYSNTGASSVPAALSAAQLASIYDGTLTTYVAGGQTRTYKPLLPQANSGTRAFFLKSLGLVEADVAWITAPTVQENSGLELDGIGEIAPFSVASYIAQTNTSTTGVPNTIVDNEVKIGSIISGSTVYPAVGTDGKLNPSFPVAHTRSVYNVVETARLLGGAKADTTLINTFQGSGSAVCSAGATISAYGFGTIADCGAVTLTGGHVTP
jgi:hypothetical protein